MKRSRITEEQMIGVLKEHQSATISLPEPTAEEPKIARRSAGRIRLLPHDEFLPLFFLLHREHQPVGTVVRVRQWVLNHRGRGSQLMSSSLAYPPERHQNE